MTLQQHGLARVVFNGLFGKELLFYRSLDWTKFYSLRSKISTPISNIYLSLFFSGAEQIEIPIFGGI